MIKKVIYGFYDKQSDHQYKIGKADQRVNQSDDISLYDIAKNRIHEEYKIASTRGDLDKYITILFVNDISDSPSSRLVESYIHTNLQLEGFSKLDRILDGKSGSTEWFDTYKPMDNEITRLVSGYIKDFTGKTGLKKYIDRIYQAYIKNLILDDISTGSKNIGAELAARYGKTAWCLNTFDESGKRILLLPSYVLTAHSSFEKTLNKYSNFNDMVYIKDKDIDFEDVIKNEKEKKIVVAISLHTPEDSWKKYKCINDISAEEKIAFMDEADYGTHTKNSRRILNLLGCETNIYMTGTSIDRAISGLTIDKIHQWCYMDMLLWEKGEHPLVENPNKGSSEVIIPNLYKISLPNSDNIQKDLPELFQTKWSKLLKDVKGNSFILKTIIKSMFNDSIDNPKHYELSQLSLSKITEANVSMIFGGFPNKVQHNNFVRLVSTCLGDDFEVRKINGDETTNRKVEEEVKKVVAKAKIEGKKVILISKDMGSRSFSVSEIDVVFLMYDNGSLSQTIQKSSRAFTPGKTYYGEEKKDGVIVTLSLDANRETLDTVDQYIIGEAIRLSNDDESIQESIKRIARSFNIFESDLNGKMKVEPDKYANELLSKTKLSDIASFSIKFNELNEEDLFDNFLFEKHSKQLTNKEKVVVNITNVKTFVDDEDDEDKEKTEKEKDNTNNTLRNIVHLVKVPDYLYMAGGMKNIDIKKVVRNIKETKREMLVEESYGLKFKLIEKLVNENIIPCTMINTIMESVNKNKLNFSL